METTYTYKDFMQAVDEMCATTLGCSAHDLPDYPYHQDWETCQEDLAFIAPEDTERHKQVFTNHVGYTTEDLIAECGVDSASGGLQGIDY
jgi:hypothetical protein